MSARCVCDLCVRALCVCQRAAQCVSVFAARWVSYESVCVCLCVCVTNVLVGELRVCLCCGCAGG